jgi:single-strand DNA-binding protein
MIKLTLIGNLGKDCVVNNVNGKNVINFNVAHTEKFKDSSGMQKEKTIWIECAYWSDRTGIAPYLKKGTNVYLEGSPDVRTYTTNDGKQGASLRLTVQFVQLLGGRNNEGGVQNDNQPLQQQGNATYGNNNTYNNTHPAAQAAPVATQDEPMDDLPF